MPFRCHFDEAASMIRFQEMRYRRAHSRKHDGLQGRRAMLAECSSPRLRCSLFTFQLIPREYWRGLHASCFAQNLSTSLALDRMTTITHI